MSRVSRPGERDRPTVPDDAPRTSRRRLLVACVAAGGVAVSVLAATWVGMAPGLYVGKAEVVVHPPPTATVTNPLATPNQEAVRFAALVTEYVTNGEERPRVTNQNLTLADQGMRHDTTISLVNLGGQWANDFSRPFIRVEAVDTSPEAAAARLTAGVEQVTRTLERLQDEAHVPAATRATAEVVPAAPQVRYQATHRTRAMAATLLLGLALTGLICGWIGRRPLPAPRTEPPTDRPPTRSWSARGPRPALAGFTDGSDSHGT